MTRLAAVATIVLMVGSACTQDKSDVARAPFDTSEDGKADSLRKPIQEGTIRVGQTAHGDLTAVRGWISYEIELTAGASDVILSGMTREGDELDTVVYVFGPRRANGKYPSAVLDYNDDSELGGLGSRLPLDAPADGTYRIVVSTYENYWSFPTNVSRGTYQLLVKCPRGVAGECGPTVSPLGGVCWADVDCGSGAHCEGEITCAPGTQCLWVREGACVEDSAWMAIGPRQCGANPWQMSSATGDGQGPTYPTEELLQLDNHLESIGIDVLDVGQLWPAEPLFTCSACSCPRGDALIVRARAHDVGRLESELGFVRLSDEEASWRSYAPAQCGQNPWPHADPPRDEAQSVADWATAEGAPLETVGFVYRTEDFTVCAACSCPRGDLLVVRAESLDDATELQSRGFGPLQTP